MRSVLLRRLVEDERGTASIEFTIVLAVMVAAFLGAGMVIGPAVHDYANRLKAVTLEAHAVLNELKAAQAPAAPPAP